MSAVHESIEMTNSITNVWQSKCYLGSSLIGLRSSSLYGPLEELYFLIFVWRNKMSQLISTHVPSSIFI